jgi:hypothetical protein
VRGLTQDQEDDLRGFFGGALDVLAGSRSALGPMLERMKYHLPNGDGGWRGYTMGRDGNPHKEELVANDAEERLIAAMVIVARQRIIRSAMATLTRSQAEVLRTVFSPIPEQLVLGLVSAFENRETAAVALLSVAVDTPGASRAKKLRELAERARGRKNQGPSEKARAELADRCLAAKAAIRDAVDAYIAALREVQRAAREAKRRRFAALLQAARQGRP